MHSKRHDSEAKIAILEAKSFEAKIAILEAKIAKCFVVNLVIVYPFNAEPALHWKDMQNERYRTVKVTSFRNYSK